MKAKYVKAREGVQAVRGQLQAKDFERRRTATTKRQLDALAATNVTVETFEPLGRMY